eukprot:1394112-Amorphochlora_amoeboformis.AAC.2
MIPVQSGDSFNSLGKSPRVSRDLLVASSYDFDLTPVRIPLDTPPGCRGQKRSPFGPARTSELEYEQLKTSEERNLKTERNFYQPGARHVGNERQRVLGSGSISSQKALAHHRSRQQEAGRKLTIR